MIFGKQKSERDHLIRSLSKNLDNKADDELLRILENYEAVMGDEGIAGLKKAYNNETSLTMQKDQQKIVDFINNHLENQKTNPHREIILISGGPGTGKTIVGIRFILEYIKIFNQGKNDNKVIFCLPKSQTVKAVFDSTCAVDEENDREYCCYLQEISKNQNLVVVDEAHRITELEKKLNTVFNKGTKLVILLQDDRQLLRPGEQGTSTAIKDYAIKHNIAFSPSNDKEKEILTLKDEKRCDDSLYQGLIKLFFDDTASINAPISCVSVFNKLSDLEHWQAEMAKTSKTKYIFPFCWAWTSKYDSESNDIKIGSFQKKWNPEDTDEQVMWLNDNSDDRVACIYTSQGLDMDNVAFVWWSDLIWDEHKSKWVTNIKELKDPAFNAKYDNETHVWRQLKWDHKEHKNVLMPDSFSISQDEIDTLIKNTYYVMLSRPRKELGIWFKHEATKKHVLEVLGIKESNR